MATVGTQPHHAAAMLESKPPRHPGLGSAGGPEKGAGVGRISASGNLDAYLSAVREALQTRSFAGLVSPLEEELEEELDNLSIVDEPNVDLSVPAPGSGDTFSNAAPHEFRKGSHVFWATPLGEVHGVVEEVATCAVTLTEPADEMLGEQPRAGRGIKGGGGWSREHPHPIRVDAKMSAPVYIIRNDDGKQVAKKPWELATIRRAASVGSLGSLASASSLL